LGAPGGDDSSVGRKAVSVAAALDSVMHSEEICEGTVESGHCWWRGWRAFRSSAPELEFSGRDGDRSAQLSPFPTTALPGCNGLAFTRRDRLSAAQCFEPAEKYSRMAR